MYKCNPLQKPDKLYGLVRNDICALPFLHARNYLLLGNYFLSQSIGRYNIQPSDIKCKANKLETSQRNEFINLDTITYTYYTYQNILINHMELRTFSI